MTDKSKCIILMPVLDTIERITESCLRELAQNGYTIYTSYGNVYVDLARSQMASLALEKGFEELFWIDSDISFNVEDFEKIRSHELPIVCGIYAKKEVGPNLTFRMPPGDHTVVFGQGGGLIEVETAPAGFLYTHCSVYKNIKKPSIFLIA